MSLRVAALSGSRMIMNGMGLRKSGTDLLRNQISGGRFAHDTATLGTDAGGNIISNYHVVFATGSTIGSATALNAQVKLTRKHENVAVFEFSGITYTPRPIPTP